MLNYAERCSISIVYAPLPQNVSVSVVSNDGKCFIGLDEKALKTEADKRTHLAHEIGHCETGAFYNPYSKFNVRNKCERKADKWAIKKLIPEDELVKAVENHLIEVWDLAEYFDVTCEFMQKALDYYATNGKLAVCIED